MTDPTPPTETVPVRMLWDLGGHHRNTIIDIDPALADLYIAAGYVERVN